MPSSLTGIVSIATVFFTVTATLQSKTLPVSTLQYCWLEQHLIYIRCKLLIIIQVSIWDWCMGALS